VREAFWPHPAAVREIDAAHLVVRDPALEATVRDAEIGGPDVPGLQIPHEEMSLAAGPGRIDESRRVDAGAPRRRITPVPHGVQ
jgi:hypothetical protein